MDPRQQLTGVLAARAGGPLVARLVGVAERVDTLVAGPAVGNHPCARLYMLSEESAQRGASVRSKPERNIRNQHHKYALGTSIRPSFSLLRVGWRNRRDLIRSATFLDLYRLPIRDSTLVDKFSELPSGLREERS